MNALKHCKCFNIELDKVRKLVEENLSDLGFYDEFLHTAPKVWILKEKSDNLDFTENKNFCSDKDTVKRMKRESSDLERILAQHVSVERLVSKLHNRHKNSTTKKNQLKI